LKSDFLDKTKGTLVYIEPTCRQYTEVHSESLTKFPQRRW